MKRILESDQRLSHSLIWDLQTAAYHSFGANAWSQKGVPSYITSNPFIADKYAQVVLGYIRDGMAAQTIDPSQTLYILDLGAGTGRFGYSFLLAFQQLLTFLKNIPLKFCYVMTDFTEVNIDFWRNHPYLQKSIAEGVLDFALYHHSDQHPLRLKVQNIRLDNLLNPMVVIANYFFDTIPQDLFRVKKGVLEEGTITLSIPDDSSNLEANDPAIIMHLIPKFSYFPIKEISNYYKEPLFNSILAQYADRLNSTTAEKEVPFYFSVGAYQVVDHFKRMAKKGLLLIAADQGLCTEEDLQNSREPYISKHGSFSIPVNYDALGKYFGYLGGKTFITEFREPSFVVTASVLGQDSDCNFEETALAFRTHIDDFGPADYFELVTFSDQEWAQPNLEKMLMLLKLGRWDPSNFNEFFEKIRKEVKIAPEAIKQQLQRIIFKVWEQFYPVSKEEALFVMNLGVLMFEMKCKEDALFFFQKGLEIDLKKSLILKNIASCYRSMGRADLAKEYMSRALSA